MIQLIEPSEVVRAARLFPAASRDKTKPALQSLLIEPVNATRLALCATDGFVMAWTLLDREEPHGLTQGVLVPNAAFKALVKGAKGRFKPFLTLEDGMLRLGSATDGIALHQPTQANYPAWRRVLPNAGSDLQPLTGHKLVMSVAWQVAEVLSDPSDGKYDLSPGRQHLCAQGVRFGATDMLMFHRDGVFVIAQEPRFRQDAPVLDLDALRAGLNLSERKPVEVPA